MEKLIRKLREHNIDISVVSNQLNLNIPEGLDASNIIEEIKANKEELISFINKIKSTSNFTRIEPVPKKEHYVLSSAQKRLYFLNQFDQSSIAYNMPQISYLQGRLDKDKLKEALNKLIARHESLRTSFVLVDDKPVQKISDDAIFDLEYYKATTEDEVPKIIEKFVRPFNLMHAPLFRAGIIERAGVSGEHLDQVLMIDMHHIIGDGVSLSILLHDFTTFYQGKTLPDLRLQYKDYAEWQQDEHQKNIVDKREFWLKEFKEEAPVLDLPADFTRPLIKSYAGGKTGFDLGKEETVKLKQIAEKEGATMFMVMLSLYNILFSKICDTEDVVVGTSTAGRQHADVERIIGVFINTVPLRNYPKEDLTFVEFLAEVKEKSLACFDNQAYPYEALIEELNVARDISRNPLFEVFFQYNHVNATGANSSEPEMSSQTISATEIVSKFDISLRANESDLGIRCIIEYSTALFREETIEKLMGCFKRIISSVIENSAVKLSEINIISDEEEQQLTVGFNNTEMPFPKETTISSLFEDQVIKTPDATAVIVGGNAISYQQLKLQSDRIADYLKNQYAVKSGDLIGLLLPRNEYLIPSIIGILKTGAAYVPIDPEYPVERIQYIIKDSEINIVLTTPSLSQIYEELPEIKPVDVASIEESRDTHFRTDERCLATDMAYMIYTSGSTGQPKGVMIEHRNVVNFVNGVCDRINFNDAKAVLCHTTVSFDIFVLESILPLLTGMKLIMATDDEQKDPGALLSLIQKHQIDCLQITPSQLKLLLSGGDQQQTLSNIKRLMVGGEAFPGDLLIELKKQYTGLIYNMYGPTETTVWSTIKDLTYSSVVTIGQPIANTIIRIINSKGKLVPVGVFGELCIGGEGVGRGYWKKEELTREKFIVDPVGGSNVIYKTGDLARWLPDGTIQFSGRIDDQVKIRGHRIELGEIEYQLAMHEGIAESVVIVNEKGGDKHLAAYYVAKDKLRTSEVRDFLLKKLPDYMVPSIFVPIPSMPLTPNKKIDRKALKNIEMVVGDDYVAPSTPTEEKLVNIWAEVLVLKQEHISVTQSFFEVGGHSLNAVTVVNKIYKEFNVEYSLKELFLNANIKAIAENIETRLWLNESETKTGASATKEIII